MVSLKFVEGTEHRQKFWHYREHQERSFIIYKFYVTKGLSNEDVKPQLDADRLNNWSNALYPFACFQGLRTGLRTAMPRTFLHGMSTQKANAYFGLATGVSWFFWWNFGPVYNNLLQEKEIQMWRIFEKVGSDINNLNEMLPRSWTEDYIHTQIRRVYLQRHSRFSGMFTVPEETAGYIGDNEMIPMWDDNTAITF